ncbi:MAG: S9 family peptidase [Actinobacteria bacterium]|nr:S9 family peptidase [Actinomycetota bacterium]
MPTITAAMCARGRSLSEPRLSPDGRSVAFVTRDGNGSRLVVVPVDGGPEVVVTADPAPAFRGGVFDWSLDGATVVFATGRGDIVRTPAAGGAPTTLAAEATASAVAVGRDGRIAYAADAAAVCVLDTTTRHDVADFALDPAWSPDGTRLAWHEWDVPDMPWDRSRIVVADLAGGTPTTIDTPDGSAAQQPRFSPDGERLAFLCDATGWLNLWVADGDGSDPRPLLAEPHEHGGPTWGPGQSTFAWSPDGGRLAFSRNEAGFGRLCVLDLATGAVEELGKGVHTALSWRDDTIACLRSGARTPTAVVAYRRGERTTLARGPVGGFELALPPEPRVVTWQADDGADIHGRLYAPSADKPLLVWVHGGPTDQRRVEFDARLAYFLDHGWAVLFPDFRGSTGWGRAYTQALHGGWGMRDTADTAAGVRAATANRWGDPTRTVVMGGSAGGLVVLRTLAHHPGLCAAGVALYPVCDLLDLAAGTHRYEAHYTHHLIGPLPGSEDEHRRRSPMHDAARIRDPLLVLHGTEDPVVPASQSAALADAVRAAGGTVERHLYEGEGHGWARPATTEDELERVRDFLARNVLG